ncbi:MAG: hypothetical protein HC782_02085 [Gammaproteobacteria bacterium]|nr:hypothetical protein [Gammaproteobacteria bacterium]
MWPFNKNAAGTSKISDHLLEEFPQGILLLFVGENSVEIEEETDVDLVDSVLVGVGSAMKNPFNLIQ